MWKYLRQDLCVTEVAARNGQVMTFMGYKGTALETSLEHIIENIHYVFGDLIGISWSTHAYIGSIIGNAVSLDMMI